MLKGKTAKDVALAEKADKDAMDKLIRNQKNLKHILSYVSSIIEELEKTSNVKEEVKSNTNPPQQIAQYVIENLENGKKFSSNSLFKVSDKAFGGTQAENKYTVKDSYDSMELGVNQYLLNQNDIDLTTKDLNEAKKNVEKLKYLLNLLPTQTKRTKETVEYQQFSTPPTIAYIASYAANINGNDTVLEPSAGIGGLATFAKINGAKVIVNELSERRLNILKNLPFDGFYNENAEQIDNILPDDIKPTVVLMNPPFSATAGRLSKMDTRFAKRHIEQALNRLEEGGRLVAIVGRGMSDYAPTFRDWWNEIKKEYNVLANITLDGENYRKYGTTFDINIVVIDKNGPTSNTIVDKVKDLNNLLELLEGIKNVRQEVSKRSEDVKPSADKPTNTKTTEENRLGDRRRNPISNTDDRLGSRGEDTKNADNKESRADSSKTKNVKKTKKDNEDTRGMDRDRGAKTDKKSEGDGSLSDNESNRDGGKSIEVEVKTDKEIKKDNKKSLGDSVFTEYVPQKLKIKGAKKHPGKLTQSAAMGSVEPPDPTYKPSLPKDVIEEGKLSIAQLEAVVYAGQSHEQILPSGERRGFFIGDGTGVGKGREIAGIILDNFNKGRKKAVWISLSQKLYQDAKRDAQSLGMDISKIYNLGKYKMEEDIKLEEGIMYTTYATLRQNLMLAPSGGKEYLTSKQGKSRLNQLVRWLGKDFDGVIVFDEAHKMGNASDGEFGKKATKQALAGLELQRLLPKARIVYVSATGATEVENLAYATRLGLWGKGTPFANVNDFISKISAGGLAAMEMVAKDMKAMGVYISRSLSYEGVQYDKLVHKLTDDQKQIYDTMSRAWQIILQNIEKALEATGGNKNSGARRNARQAFWSSQQRFYNQILTSMQS